MFNKEMVLVSFILSSWYVCTIIASGEVSFNTYTI